MCVDEAKDTPLPHDVPWDTRMARGSGRGWWLMPDRVSWAWWSLFPWSPASRSGTVCGSVSSSIQQACFLCLPCRVLCCEWDVDSRESAGRVMWARHRGAVWHDWLQRDMLRSAGKHTGGPSLLLIRAQRSDSSSQSQYDLIKVGVLRFQAGNRETGKEGTMWQEPWARTEKVCILSSHFAAYWL